MHLGLLDESVLLIRAKELKFHPNQCMGKIIISLFHGLVELSEAFIWVKGP